MPTSRNNPSAVSAADDNLDALRLAAQRLATDVGVAAKSARNEASLRHTIEISLERECARLNIPWTPNQLERALRNETGSIGFADAVHGALIIEYEAPQSFDGQAAAKLDHAKQQAEDYAVRIAREEGRPLEDYILIVWDGSQIAFGSLIQHSPLWQPLESFTFGSAERLLRLLRQQGRPLVHPAILRVLVSPESQIGANLIPRFFEAIIKADVLPANGHRQTKTGLLLTEWKRLFGQAVGIETERLEAFLESQVITHGARYRDNVPAYLFALHSYIALVAKLVAAMALPRASEDVANPTVPLRRRLRALETGQIFADAGVTNMLAGDFFSWYVDDEQWLTLESPIESLINRLRGISFDIPRKTPDSVRDLFKGIYQEFVPRELRHALGEVYTPDWLAEHALDRVAWQPDDDLLDPTCGTGTFLLEAIKRRLRAAERHGDQPTGAELLKGIYGIDLNPLAVLASKASLVVVLASYLSPVHPLSLPVYLADAINSTDPAADDTYVHVLQTELGEKRFELPGAIARSPELHEIFKRLHPLIAADIDGSGILQALQPILTRIALSADDIERFAATVKTLVEMHHQGWDGIWCAILADRFAAGAIGKVSHLAGNPPWVKWSHLPPEYAKFIKPQCLEMNVFSADRYVGGIESDISTIITFKAIRRWLAPQGRLAFFITATVFSNESSQGFRRFEYNDGAPMAAVLGVEDYKAIAPFEGATNHPALLLVENGGRTQYPVLYRVWQPGAGQRTGQRFADAEEFRAAAIHRDLLAQPVPGTDAGPWLKGTATEHEVWRTLFDASRVAPYQARKGVTTDLNGVYFVRVESGDANCVWVRNDPTIGRTHGLASTQRLIEKEHVFPLMRGRGLKPFQATLDPDFKIIVPQRGMHGDPSLPLAAPRTHQYFTAFEDHLRTRGSYRRYQQGQPYWSTWSTGPYTFSPYKVLWQEMRGHRFCAAYLAPVHDPVLGERVVVPDHKLYFVPLSTLAEAQYLTGVLNAPTIASAISAYAAQLSLGVSVVENLKIPAFNADDSRHLELASIAGAITDRGGAATGSEMDKLDALAGAVVSGQ